MMANEGRIEAFDIYEHKLPLIRQQADRLGIEIITAGTMDSAEGSESLYETADKLLADVPCSGLGVIRRKPEIKYKEIQDFTELEVLQGRILEKSSQYLKIGGTLVYSTCTIRDRENGGQIRRFLEKHREFELIEERQLLPTEDIDGFYICKMLKKG